MKEKLTRGVLEAMKKCRLDCSSCSANEICSKYDWQDTRRALASALLEERAEPKDDVWKNAPEWATTAGVFWEDQEQLKRGLGPVFIRELPKTRARKDAEELFDELSSHGMGRKQGIDAIEALLNKYAEELEGSSDV